MTVTDDQLSARLRSPGYPAWRAAVEQTLRRDDRDVHGQHPRVGDEAHGCRVVEARGTPEQHGEILCSSGGGEGERVVHRSLDYDG